MPSCFLGRGGSHRDVPTIFLKPYVLPDGATNRGRLNMTANRGAGETRSKILRKIREIERAGLGSAGMRLPQEYVKGMAQRAGAKKGGLGRR